MLVFPQALHTLKERGNNLNLETKCEVIGENVEFGREPVELASFNQKDSLNN